MAAQAEAMARFSSDPDTVVISYNLISHLLAQPDTTPLIRVYGDGRVVVHYPAYSPKAGDYETTLSTGEMAKLLNMVVNNGLIGFNRRDFMAKRNQVKRTKERATGIAHAISEIDETLIKVHLDEYQSEPNKAIERNVQKKISWDNLAFDMKFYPEVSELRKLAEAEKMLRAILERDDLSPH